MDSGRCPLPGWHVSGPDSASGAGISACRYFHERNCEGLSVLKSMNRLQKRLTSSGRASVGFITQRTKPVNRNERASIERHIPAAGGVFSCALWQGRNSLLSRRCLKGQGQARAAVEKWKEQDDFGDYRGAGLQAGAR
jgi:hypothetical protein